MLYYDHKTQSLIQSARSDLHKTTEYANFLRAVARLLYYIEKEKPVDIDSEWLLCPHDIWETSKKLCIYVAHYNLTDILASAVYGDVVNYIIKSIFGNTLTEVPKESHVVFIQELTSYLRRPEYLKSMMSDKELYDAFVESLVEIGIVEFGDTLLANISTMHHPLTRFSTLLICVRRAGYVLSDKTQEIVEEYERRCKNL